MTLNERKTKILEAIIYDYITHGEPVSSRTIEKRYNLGVSSATIRNEMSDLEELGFILQPHTSAGRVPTDLGYRLHVDRMVMQELTDEQQTYLKNTIASNISHMGYLMKETAKAISLLTNYTTIVSEVSASRLTIQHVQLMPMDNGSIAVTVITITKLIKNAVVPIDPAPDIATLNRLTSLLNNLLAGKSADDIRHLSLGTSPETPVLEAVLDAIITILTTEEEIAIFTSGVNNILAYPGFDDMAKAQNMFKALEQKDMLITLLGHGNEANVQVIIGSENNLEELKDCSIIRASYGQNGQPLGSIGIIGPTRMDYAAVSSVLNAVVKKINTALLLG